MNANGERISIFTNNISVQPGIEYEQFIPLIEDADFVVVNLSDYTKKILPMVKDLGKPIWVDLHDYDGQNPWHADYVKYADYVLLSSDNMPDYKPFMKRMIDDGKELVVVTHGKQGSTGLDKNGQWFDIEINRGFELIDSNGAGDAYFSGFLYGFDKGDPIEKCMQYGTLVGGLCINSDKLYNSRLSEDLLTELFEKYYS
jgi:sugar/nucleoside kinase (ribokinase family)